MSALTVGSADTRVVAVSPDDLAISDHLHRYLFEFPVGPLVVRVREDGQVVGRVVLLLAIDVVDDLTLYERPAERLLGNESVLVHVRVGSAITLHSPHEVAVPVDGEPSTPGGVFCAFRPRGSERRQAGFPAMELEGLVRRAPISSDRTEALAAFQPSFKFCQVHRHDNILPRRLP